MASSCNETLSLTANGWFWGSKAIKIALSPCAVLLNVTLIIALYRCSNTYLHINMRCLMTNLSVASTIASGYLMVKEAYTFGIILFGDKCNLEVSFSTCKNQEALFIFSKMAVLGSILGLGCERAYAVFHLKQQASSKNPLLAVLILSITWLCSFGITCALLFTVPDGTTPYCNALFIYRKDIIRILSGILLPLECFGVISYIGVGRFVVHHCEQAFDDAEYTLQIRFQKKATLMITKAMFPSSVLHAICWLLILGVAAVQLSVLNVSLQQNLILSQYLFYGLALVHMTLHPMFCFYYFKILHKELASMFPFLAACFRFTETRQPDSTYQLCCTNECAQHFDLLNDMWDMKYAEKIKDGHCECNGLSMNE